MSLDALFLPLSSATGVRVPELKMVISFLISYPLASLHTRIPASRPNLAHLYNIAISVFFIWPFLGMGTGMLHLLLDIGVTYGLVVGSRDRQMPWHVFGFVMGHLFLMHAHRYFVGLDPDQSDITFAMMMMAQKLTMFAWNVHDGRSKTEELDANQMATRLLHVPSPLAYLGYCFFFPSVLAGPTMDYATYDSLILDKIYDHSPPPEPSASSTTSTKAAKRRIPYGRKRVAYLYLALGAGFMAFFAMFGGRGSYQRILGPEWLSWGPLTRFGFIQFAGLVARTKYYGVWSFTEGACILTGVGFNGYDPKTGRTLWNRVRNVNIISIEAAESFKMVFDNWNCRTNVWLRDCVYKRLVKKGKKPGSMQSMATFLTSAVWHGIDPGYYLAFLGAGLITSLGRQTRNFIRPYFLAPSSAPQSAPNALPKFPYPNSRKRFYDVLGWIVVQSNLNYLASSFMLLGFSDCIKAYHRMGWYAHIITFGGMAFFHFGGRRWLRSGLPAPPSTPKTAKLNTAVQGRSGTGSSLGTPSVRIEPPSPVELPPQPKEETDPNDLKWVRHALEGQQTRHGASAGRMGGDAGWVDEVMKGQETPMAETPNWSRSGSPGL